MEWQQAAAGMEGEASKNVNSVVEQAREMVEMIEKVGTLNDFRKTQRKECVNLVRRLKLLTPLLEEIRESETDEDEDEEAFKLKFNHLVDLNIALLASKKLLKTCNSGSKIFLVSLSFPLLSSSSLLFSN